MIACEKKEKTSQYKGVAWNKGRKKWFVLIKPKGHNSKYGGYFKDELDAAKRANQLCEQLGIPLQNPKISIIANEQDEVTKNSVLSHGVGRKSEL